MLVSSVSNVSRVLKLTWDLERAAVATQEAIKKAHTGLLVSGVAARDDLTVTADSVAALADGWSMVVLDGGSSSGDTGGRDDGGDDLGDLHICGLLFEAERLERR